MSLVKSVEDALKRARLEPLSLIGVGEEAGAFGDATVVANVEPFLLRVTSDRGQVFLDLAHAGHPTDYWQLDDVEIGMGWRRLEEVVALCQPEPLDAKLQRFKANYEELCMAFSSEKVGVTVGRIGAAAKERGAALMARLGQ